MHRQTDTQNNQAKQSDSNELDSLLPHRPPMRLINKVLQVSDKSSRALVIASAESPFYIAEKGIPAWIGLELMGQTAALIAGWQQQHGDLAPHTGFLLGCRQYNSRHAWFLPDQHYQVDCVQDTILGDTLASFQCEIRALEPTPSRLIANAMLTVFREARNTSTDSHS